MNKKISDLYAIFLLLLGISLYACSIIIILLSAYAMVMVFTLRPSRGTLILGVCLLLITAILAIGLCRALFPSSPKGFKLIREEYVSLFRMIEATAHKVGTRVPDHVLLVPGSEIAVYGMFTRTLLLGAVSLRQLSAKEMECILAHEMAHFGNADTRIGMIVGTIHRTLSMQAQSMKLTDASGLLIWHLLKGINYAIYSALRWIFLLFYAPYSRSREYLADAVAARVTSAQAFCAALQSYVYYTSAFQAIVPQQVIIILQQKMLPSNVYQDFHVRYWQKNASSFISKNEKAIFSQDDSITHPCIRNRMANLHVEKIVPLKHQSSCSTLIPDLQQKEIELSKLYTMDIGLQTGLLIAEAAPEN